LLPVAADQLIDRSDQGVEFILGVGLKVSELFEVGRSALRQADFGLG